MKKLSRILSVVLSLTLCAGMVLPALAVEYDISKGDVIIDSTGSSGVVMGQEESSRNEFTEDDRSVTISQSEEGPTGHTITVGENVTDTTITLNGVNIDASGSGKAAMTVGANSGVTVELDGENTLKSGTNHAGLELNGGGSVTIQDETKKDDGAALTAQGGDAGAGIGSGFWAEAGSITINGGDVTANGGNGGAGIGAGYNSNVGGITINAGDVTANGGERGAGIGSGFYGKAGGITINGGDVTATGGKQGAGVGSGYWAEAGDITINAGKVTANGGGSDKDHGSGAGIGTGHCAEVGSITINGGDVTAAGGSGGGKDYGGGAGIGTSYYGRAGDITITDGKVTAQTNGYLAAGIGTGARGTAGDITITGGDVTANGAHHAAGIGTGEYGRAGGITITGGDVTAHGGTGGAAIGGSKGGRVSSIIIVGTVTDQQGVAGVPTISTDAKNSLGGLTGAFGDSLLAGATKATVQILDSKGSVIASAEMDQEDLEEGLILRAPAGKYYVYVTTDANPEGAFVTGAGGENFAFEIGNTVVEQEKPLDVRTPECCVDYQFVSGTPDMDLPEMPEFPGDDDIVRNITSTLEASCDKEYDDIVVSGGVWSFAGWSTAPIFNEDGTLAADVTLVGTWTFTESDAPDQPGVPSQPSVPDVEISDPDVPLAGPVSLQELLEELHRRAGASGEVLAWAVDNGLAAADADGAEPVTVGAMRTILSRYAEVFATNAVAVPDLTTLTGEDGDLVLNCGEVLAEFFGEE